MQYYSLASMKQQAKNSMRMTKPSVFVSTILYFVIVLVLANLSYRLNGMDNFYSEIYQMIDVGQKVGYDDIINNIPHVSAFAGLLTAVISIMNAIIGVGYAGYCLKVSRAEQTKVLDIFRSFDCFGKALCIVLLKWLYVVLWSLLLVIPGIIAAYRYSQAFYIMFDHPEYSASECLRQSSRMMKGYKWRLFVLELSFIGWNLLNSIIEAFLYVGFLSIYIQPFTGLTHANFYNYLISWQPAQQDSPPLWEPPA